MTVYSFGLGHVGLPMAAWITLSGKRVIGIDINKELIKEILQGKVDIHEYYNGIHISDLAKNLIEKGNLFITDRFERTDFDPAIFVISVGITQSKDGKNDISPIQSVLDRILPQTVANDLLLFRTTMIPGTCENVIVPQIKQLNVPVYFAYCPETIAETHAFEELKQNPLILAAIDEDSYQKSETFLRSLSDAPIYRASNIRTAEMAKVIQNIDRDVNIALINEISEAATELGIDTYELQKLTNTHPRVNLLQPGPGVGGYCIPNAFGYLEEALAGKNSNLQLMRTARECNNYRPYKIVATVKNALVNADKDIKGATIALIGLAMKDYCADCRFSPALTIINELLALGALVKAYDPLVPINYSFQVGSFDECIRNADCLVITAKQPGITFDREQLHSAMAKPLVAVDTRNVFPAFNDIRLYKI